MDDINQLREYGLIGRIDSLASMRGEEVAIRFSADFGALQEHGDDQVVDEEASNSGSQEDDDTPEDASSSEDCSSDQSLEPYGITYMELQYAYQSVASQLQYRCGVTAGDKVLICCKDQPGAEIVALLACVKLKAAFVPIDISWINMGCRLKDIIDDAQPVAAIVVAEDDSDDAVLAFASAGLYRCVYLSNNGDAVQAFNTLNDGDGQIAETYGSNTDTDDMQEGGASEYDQYLLYVLYTSGSTGRPKGVLGTHRGLINRIAWQMEKFPFEFGEVVCRRTPLVFVDSMAEIFSALVCMVPLWCPPKERLIAEGIGGIAADANAAGVSRITLLPSQLHQACNLHPDIGALWPSLKIVFVSGEECTAGVVTVVTQRLPDVTLVNLYGSTEVAGDVTYSILCDPDGLSGTRDSDGKIPIGQAIEGNYLYVISCVAQGDDAFAHTEGLIFKLLPDGEVGELLVTGEHLAMGYHNAAQSSSTKFISNPLLALLPATDPACAYESAFLTGDLVYCRDGVYYWCGRKDRQVKVRGVRMELEDVERAAAVALQVDQQSVVALVSANTPAASDADNLFANSTFLVLFVERHGKLLSTKPLSSGDIKEILNATLIPSMHPAHVLLLDHFPRNTSGKIDRQALQRQLVGMFSAASAPHTKPLDSMSGTFRVDNLTQREAVQQIANLYRKILGLPQDSDPAMDGKQDFFGLGGDSVRMIEVLWELRQWTSVPLMPPDLLRPMEELALYLQGIITDASDDHIIKKARTGRVAPVDDAMPSEGETGEARYPAPTRNRDDSQLIFETTFLYSVGRTGTSWRHTADHSEELSSASQQTGLQSQLAVKWSVKMSKCVDASPLVTAMSIAGAESGAAVHTHRVIIGSHGGDVLSVNGCTGEKVWTLQLGEHIEAAAVPNTAGDIIFIGSYSGQDVDGFRSRRPVKSASEDEVSLGCLWTIQSLTGEVLWHFCTAGEIKASVLVLGDCVFVGAYDGHLYQLNAADGQLIAKFHCGGSIYATPVATNDGRAVAVVTTSGVISFFSYSGAQAPLQPVLSEQAVPAFATPLVVGNGVIVAGTDGSLSCRSFAQADEILWSSALSSTAIFSSPCLASGEKELPNGAIVGCHDGKLRKFSVQDGTIHWESSVGVAIFASPFALPSAKECVFATVAGDVVIVNSGTGVIKSKLRLPAEVFSSPVCIGNCIYIGCRDDRLYCLQML